MTRVKLRGMAWDHRRATGPLLGTAPLFRARHPEIEIEWSTQPLSGFEFRSVNALAEDYDFIILDHPFMGEAAASRSLVPLDGIPGTEAGNFAGPSLATYCMDGCLWARQLTPPVRSPCRGPICWRSLGVPRRSFGTTW